MSMDARHKPGAGLSVLSGVGVQECHWVLLVVSASLPVWQTWTALQHDGPDHLGLWLNSGVVGDEHALSGRWPQRPGRGGRCEHSCVLINQPKSTPLN